MADSLHLVHALTIDGTAYELIRANVREALDEVGSCRCEITDGQGGPSPADLVGKDLLLTLELGDSKRHFAGVVVEAEHTTQGGDDGIRGTVVLAEPRLFKLTRRHASRVFQEMAVKDIVEKVLDAAGVTDREWQLEGSYPARLYTTQYRETDFAFVRRLLCEEGISFAIDMSSEKDVVKFFDKDLGDVDGDKAFPFRQGEGLVGSKEAIAMHEHERVLASGKVHLRDYDFEKPQLKLDSKVECDEDAEKKLEVYVYPGRFVEQSIGDRYAQVLLDSLRARREIVKGTSSSLRLQPGRRFEVEEHPYAPLNQEYLALEVHTVHEARKSRDRGERTGSRVEFVAIPGKHAYRPKRIPVAVASPGAQLATITGPPGKEIHPDKHGRVKVHFPWDREGKTDDTSSLWIRTCQLALGGSMLTPRVGWESYLNFIDGDPDKPFVFGRMTNAEKPPAYPLPANKTRMSFQTATTPGGGSSNEFRMEDKKGSEEMFMNASKDASVSAGNNATEDVGNNETRSIGSNHNLSITDSKSNKVGADQSLSVDGDQKLNVGTFMVDDVGSHSHTISGARDVKAGGDHKRTVTGASTLDISGMQIDLVAGSVDEEALATMDDKVGAALVELTASDRVVAVTGARTEKAGAAKVILSAGGRAVTITGSLSQKVAGAILTKIKGDRSDSSEGAFLELVAGAQLVKATNVVYTAENVLSVIMGASTITLTPASVSIAGTNITFDGDCSQTSMLIADNV